MNYLKQHIILGFFLLFVGTSAMAQSKMDHPRDREAHKKEMLEKMKKKLNLSADQVAKIEAIDAKYVAKEEALRAQFEELKEARKNLHEEKKSEIDKVLNAEQREKIEKWKEKRQGRERGRDREMRERRFRPE